MTASPAPTIWPQQKDRQHHKARLMQKMNFSSNADLVRYAVESGLVT
jgi:FixJ family two-component response regulator